ncbi:MAG: type III-B CRISPR module RAMP protein Cmr1 [Gemmataceae bacterium]|nr:type III-B CRISPR module RAMP protein Cmr1 [Gemmataceae bacterium]
MPADGEPPALPTQKRVTFETTLELVTPAFLAGASQQADDCDLRPATLRGLLRWWWRTMHAGFVDVKTLRALEATIWGDTKGGGAVRLEVERLNAAKPTPVPGKRIQKDRQNRDVLRADPDFCREHGLELPADSKTSQGVLYLAFGTDEMPTGRPAERKQRFVIEPSAMWRVRLVSRATQLFANRKDVGDPTKAKHGKDITADQVLSQAKAALWLLCHFGAVGSKARKGFGSLAVERLRDHSLEACQDAAKQLRQQLGLSNRFDERHAHSPSLQQMLDPVEVTFSWPNVWSILDQVGFAYQTFAKKYKHQLEKKALGLPRRIGPPVQGKFNPTPPVTANGRHSSPVHIHVEGRDVGWTVRAIAFPAAHLPDLATSEAFLKEFLKDFGDDLRRRAALQPPPSGPGPGMPSPRQQTPPPSRGPSLPKPGERVDAILLEERTRKGGWRAQHVATGIAGPIQNSGDVPGDKKPGETVSLIVQSANEREIAFRYPTAGDEQKPKQPGSKQPPRGGRR